MAETDNIRYMSSEIVEFYRCNRQRWEDFYPSERCVFEKIASGTGSLGKVLDVGCACGGLGAALESKFSLNSYTGIDINKDAIDWASSEIKLSVPVKFISGDIVRCQLDEEYDTVVSLSCADWNIKTRDIVDACWERVRPGGYFIVSLRLTPEEGVNNISKSFQYINFYGKEKVPEVANYVVFNIKDALKMMRDLAPAPVLVGAYGYWGCSSPTAVTLYDKLVFSVFYVRKGTETVGVGEMQSEFMLPLDLFL